MADVLLGRKLRRCSSPCSYHYCKIFMLAKLNLFIYMKCIVKVFKLEGDFWFLMSAYNWNHFCSTACVLFLASCWIENWKLEKASVERAAARCTNYFQICWDATELQRGVSPTNHKRTTINQRGRSLVTKVHSLRTKDKWNDLHPTIALRPDWVISFFPPFPPFSNLRRKH